MRVKELELTNFQSYDHGEVKFPEGTTFIRGEIGTGKSTLLRAIFCALFQTDASDEALGIDTLDELVKLGEDSATVKLTFEIEGVEYTVEWTISVSEDENGKRTAKTRDCVLSSPALDEPIDGYTSVNERITGDMSNSTIFGGCCQLTRANDRKSSMGCSDSTNSIRTSPE